MSPKRGKRSRDTAKYYENQHLKTVGLPANLIFLQKNSPATVNVRSGPRMRHPMDSQHNSHSRNHIKRLGSRSEYPQTSASVRMLNNRLTSVQRLLYYMQSEGTGDDEFTTALHNYEYEE